MDFTNDNMNECVENDSKEFHQNLLEQTPTVSAENQDLGSQGADVRPVEPEDVGAGAFSFDRPDECDDEAEPEEELEGSDDGDASFEMSFERLGSRLCKMIENLNDDLGKVFHKNDENVLGITTLRDAVLELEEKQAENIEHGKRMVLDILRKFPEESE